MMYKKAEHHYPALDGPSFYGIDLAYGDSLFSMTIFLPQEGISVDSVITDLNQESWDSWMNSFVRWGGDLHMPKFEIEYYIELREVLSAMGMERAFGGGANFSEMFENLYASVFLNSVKHKTYIRVDELGTEAAAVTVSEYATGVPPQIRIDRPFLFFIRENQSNTIIFMGKIVNPGYL